MEAVRMASSTIPGRLLDLFAGRLHFVSVNARKVSSSLRERIHKLYLDVDHS